MSSLQPIIQSTMSLKIENKEFRDTFLQLFGNLLHEAPVTEQIDFMTSCVNIAIEHKLLHQLNLGLLAYSQSEIAEAWKLYRLHQISGTHPDIYKNYCHNQWGKFINPQSWEKLLNEGGFVKGLSGIFDRIEEANDSLDGWYDTMRLGELAGDQYGSGEYNCFFKRAYTITYRILESWDLYGDDIESVPVRNEYGNWDVEESLQMKDIAERVIIKKLDELLEAELYGYFDGLWNEGNHELVNEAGLIGWMEEEPQTLTNALMCLAQLHGFEEIAVTLFQSLWESFNEPASYDDDDEMIEALDRIGYIEYTGDEEEV